MNKVMAQKDRITSLRIVASFAVSDGGDLATFGELLVAVGVSSSFWTAGASMFEL